MSEMFNPPHPGGILREDILSDLNLTVTGAAKAIGVSRVALSRVVNEKAGISPELAFRLERWLDDLGYSGGRAEQWARMQLDYDMWQARQRFEAA